METQDDATKAAILRDAADKGWADVVAGHYDEIVDADLVDFLGQLGSRATHLHSPG